jgi:hypothetical protein
MNKQIWKDVVGFEGYYEISNEGNVRYNKDIVNTQYIRRSLNSGKRGGHMEVIRKAESGEYFAQRMSRVGGKDYKYYCHILLKKENGIQKDEYIHRMVAKAFVPNPEGKPVVDHSNGDTLNNRVENLRWATRGENAMNAQKCRKHGTRQITSKYKGVSKVDSRHLKQWQASCGSAGFLGRYETEREAAEAYNERAKELYGEFALLNVI